MKLLDSNILIYSYSDNFNHLRSLVVDGDFYISDITHLEGLGYHSLTEDEHAYFADIFSILKIRPIDSEIIDEAIRLRKQYKMKVADSIVAATAILLQLNLYTRNIADFDKIENLVVINPVDA